MARLRKIDEMILLQEGRYDADDCEYNLGYLNALTDYREAMTVRLRVLIEESEYSQSEIARSVKIERQLMYHYTSKKNYKITPVLERIAKFIGKKPEELLDRKEK